MTTACVFVSFCRYKGEILVTRCNKAGVGTLTLSLEWKLFLSVYEICLLLHQLFEAQNKKLKLHSDENIEYCVY